MSAKHQEQYDEITKRLRRYRSRVAEYQACKELYDTLFPSAVSNLTGMPKSQATEYEPERWAQKRMNQRERMIESLEAMREAIEDTEALVYLLEGDSRTLLIRRYLLNESYERIGEKMHYSKTQIQRMHEKALYALIREVENERAG